MKTQSLQTSVGDVTLVTLTNSKGESVTLSNLGAAIVAVRVADRGGKIDDVILGYENVADYMNDGPCMGKIPGRFANRIAKGHFTLDGKEYNLAVNCGPNHLHGGPTGFQNRIWKVAKTGSDFVKFTYHSADGEEGYPGAVDVSATYHWSDQSELTLDINAVSDAPTVINLTNHAYWNLAGHDSGSALNHNLKLNASHWLPTDDSLVPLPGKPATVDGTPMDFRLAKQVGKDIKADFAALKYGKGYDNCWVIDGEAGQLREAAVLSDPTSGRHMVVMTDQPAVQVYTGNWIDGAPLGKGGVEYHDYDGIAIECQNYPDAPNRSDFPSPVLRPGETFSRRISFRFYAE